MHQARNFSGTQLSLPESIACCYVIRICFPGDTSVLYPSLFLLFLGPDYRSFCIAFLGNSGSMRLETRLIGIKTREILLYAGLFVRCAHDIGARNPSRFRRGVISRPLRTTVKCIQVENVSTFALCTVDQSFRFDVMLFSSGVFSLYFSLLKQES